MISLVDSSIDFLSIIEREEAQNVQESVNDQSGEKRTNERFRLQTADQRFSMLIHVLGHGKPACVLFDAVTSPDGVVTNAESMGLHSPPVSDVPQGYGGPRRHTTERLSPTPLSPPFIHTNGESSHVYSMADAKRARLELERIESLP